MIESAYCFFMKKKPANTKFLTFVLFMLPALAVVAQSYERRLEWQDKNKTFSTIDGKTIVPPTFSKAAHADQYGLLPL